MMVDRRTLDRPRGAGLVSTLVAAGLEALVFDARGHGHSVPRAEHGGRFTYHDIIAYDVPAMVRFARSLAGTRRVVVVGHSLIGHAAMIAAGLFPADAPDAIVAFAPNLWAPHLEPSVLVRGVKASLLRAWIWSTAARGYFDSAAFGQGTDAETREYVAHLAAMWRSDRLQSPDGSVDYEAALARVELPVLAFSSGDDRVYARPAAVDRFLGLMQNAQVTHRVVNGLSHMGFVTDPRAKSVWEESARWIAGA